MAHVDAGKTTATERMLYYTGLIHKMGNIDQGNTVMDTNPQEEDRGITISSAAISTNWNYGNEAFKVNIIDTPGHVDFIIEVERSLRVLDGAVALFCAASGVEPQSENVWHLADKHNIPRIGFINKMDRQGADFIKVINAINEQLPTLAIPVQLPIGSADDFVGVIDLIEQKALYWPDADGKNIATDRVPADMLDDVQFWRTNLLERLAEFDLDFMETYLAGNTITSEEIIQAIQTGTIAGHFTPVLCGSAYKNKGVQPLLDAVVRYLPSPLDLPDLEGKDPVTDESVMIQRSPNEDVSALAFKIVVDRHMGKLTFVRVYSGQIKPGDMLYNPRTESKLRISRVLEIKSELFTELDQAGVGEICALVGLKDVRTGDTLCLNEKPVLLESIDIPEPVIGIAIEPKKGQDVKNFGKALAAVVEEDPSLQVHVDSQTGQTLLKGMGELHLEVVIEDLRLTHRLEINQGSPRVAYREDLNKTVVHRERLVKQTGGNGQFADITFSIGPNEKGLVLTDSTKGGIIPKEYMPSIKKGFESAMANGVLFGYPVEGCQVELLDGAIHQTDSKAMDFEIVARNGFKAACQMADPGLLEPVMKIEITTNEEFVGAVNSDLNRRRGMVTLIETQNEQCVIWAEVPLANTFGYISDLRTITSGIATINMSFSHYATVPENLWPT